jgi:hypothetical protein
MHFRKKFTVRKLQLFKLSPEGVAFHLGGPHNIRVKFRRPTADEVSHGYTSDAIFCVAESEWEPNPKVKQVLEDLAALRVPKGSKIPENHDGKWYLDDEGGLREKRLLPLSYLPDSAQQAVRQIRQELAGAIRRTVKLLRWRWSLSGPHNPFAAREDSYSLDGTVWRTLPTDLSVSVEGSSSFTLTESRREQFAELLSSNAEEPLGHELLREAADLRHIAPRSALLVGMSAVEVGFKELVADLVPKAGWLVEESPTPPVIKMLDQYLPTLPARLDFSGRVLPPPSPIMEELKKAIFARNKVTHAGGRPLTGDTLDEVLRAVEDVLWLFDYYAGRKWALNHLRRETRTALTGTPEAEDDDDITLLV